MKIFPEVSAWSALWLWYKGALRKTFLRHLWLLRTVSSRQPLFIRRAYFVRWTHRGGFTDTGKYLFDRRKGPVLWISALWAVLLWAAGRGRSALLQTAVFPCSGRKRKDKVSAQAFGHQRSQLKLPRHPRKRNLWHAGL